jgi:hypothetical protein
MRSFGYGRVEEEENRTGAGWREGPIVRTAHRGYGERQGEGQGQGAKSVAGGQAHPQSGQVGQVAELAEVAHDVGHVRGFAGEAGPTQQSYGGDSDESGSSRGDCAAVQFGG